MGDAEPYTLTYGYSPEVTGGPYAGGGLFPPTPLRLGAMTEHGKRFRTVFEREDAVAMPPEHLEMLRFWLGLWRGHRDVLLDGKLAPLHPACGI